jgi:CBS domain-containing protein
MSPPPVTASPTATVAGFIDDVVLHERFSTYPLVDGGGRLSGLVTLNRIRQVPVAQRATTALRDIACPPEEVPTARPDEPLADLLPRLAAGADGRAIVVDADERVLAVVSPRDISRVAAVADLRTGRPFAPQAEFAPPPDRPSDHPAGRAPG